jgi:hypothetical protein
VNRNRVSLRLSIIRSCSGSGAAIAMIWRTTWGRSRPRCRLGHVAGRSASQRAPRSPRCGAQ